MNCMPKIAEFKKIETRVLNTLEEIAITRDDDMLLYYFICDKIMTEKYNGGFDLKQCNVFDFMTSYKQFDLPSYETVSRARRKIVNGKRPDLQSKERKSIRQAEIPSYKEYALT